MWLLVLVPWASRAEGAATADQIEFLSGAKIQGTVTKIDKVQQRVTLRATIAGRQLTRVYPYRQIHAVTYRGQRYVLNNKPAAGSLPNPASGSPGALRTREAIDKLINDIGRTPPDWYESTPVEHPPGLDLSWPEPAPPPWDNRKNMGQYIWDIINPNSGRWRSGVRLMHHLLALNKDDAQVRRRVMQSLGGMYFRFFQDYPRAAFWWRQAGVKPGHPDSVALAECYWRLGNKAMAVELLKQRTLRPSMIKLWGDMGETDRALQVAETYVHVGGQPQIAYLNAGDACRLAGRYSQAVDYYQRVIDAPVVSQAGHVDQNRKRAQINLQAIKLFELSDPTRVADGTYRASSLGYEDQVHVQVEVQKGKIQSVEVTEHREKQFYSALTDVPQQIIAKQGVKGVDMTSGATITAEAITNATAKALASGARK